MWTAEEDTPLLSPSPIRPRSVCPCLSPQLVPLLSGRDRRTQWPSQCWWGQTSHPSGRAARRGSRWRMRNGTVAGSGTATPSWLWGLKESWQIGRNFESTVNRMLQCCLQNGGRTFQFGNYAQKWMSSCLQMCDCSQLVTGLYHKGIEQEKIFSLSFIFTIFVHFPSNLSYSVPQQNNSDTNFTGWIY